MVGNSRGSYTGSRLVYIKLVKLLKYEGDVPCIGNMCPICSIKSNKGVVVHLRGPIIRIIRMTAHLMSTSKRICRGRYFIKVSLAYKTTTHNHHSAIYSILLQVCLKISWINMTWINMTRGHRTNKRIFRDRQILY